MYISRSTFNLHTFCEHKNYVNDPLVISRLLIPCIKFELCTLNQMQNRDFDLNMSKGYNNIRKIQVSFSVYVWYTYNNRLLFKAFGNV